ncbi:MAG: hypothetical protein KDA24_27090 [Deltaproteobacteria bacterium]|nr:hypothetical protein [Deltaproteobacteria bacterium]
MPRPREAARPLLAALAIAAVSAVRVVVFGLLDRRPLYGGWEAPDLQRSMFYHYGLRGHLDWTFAEQVARDAFKPPLWYGGVPLLYSWDDSLHRLDYLLPNALCAGALVLGGFALGRRLGGPIAGLVSAALCAVLPGIAWRVAMIGVEPAHAALLVGSLLLLVGLVQSARDGAAADCVVRGVGLGVCIGAATLMKWNFVAYVTPPLVLSVLVVGREGLGRLGLGLLAAGGFAAAIFGPWALGFADLGEIFAQGADGEASQAGAGYYLSELAGRSLGLGGWAALVAAAFGLWRGISPTLGSAAPRPRVEAGILGAAVLALWLTHLAIPHKETRYLLPALPLLCALLGGAAARLAPLRGGGLALTLILLVGLGGSWIHPLLDEPATNHNWTDVLPAPIDEDYGVDGILAHPTLGERERTVVTFSLREEAIFPVLTFLQWELYGRNANPVLSRSSWPDVTLKACAFDLERSTHFLSNRTLNDQEEAALRSMGFERVVTVAPRVQDVGVLQLWALEERSEPRYR